MSTVNTDRVRNIGQTTAVLESGRRNRTIRIARWVSDDLIRTLGFVRRGLDSKDSGRAADSLIESL